MSREIILTSIGAILTALSSLVAVVKAPDVSAPPPKLVAATAELQANADRVHAMLHLTH